MPRRDKTGPFGQGPATGLGMGYCAGETGWRRGFCRGFGRFWRFGSRVTQKEEKDILEGEAKVIEDELKAIKTRLAELGGR